MSIWQATRRRIWEQDQQRCQGPYCRYQPPHSLSLSNAHIDHIVELSRGGSNDDRNLRTLCRRCHCLRANHTHQGMIGVALREGIIPINWREYVWEG
ncbi:MAG: HNH endonuclease [Cyanothece sp. SIO2G6]|nr:HNH endonuclease [Cyanothece sp. SIO2G6]